MQGLPFVHSQFAAVALGAAAVPVVIHLINRRRYVMVPWAAMRFLQAAGKKSARRMRLDHWTLMLVRMAVIGLVCLAVARPFFPFEGLGILGQSMTHRVLVIDNSSSMAAEAPASAERPGAVPAGWSRFDEALAVAEELIGSFERGDAVSVVGAARPAEAVVGYAAFDRRRIRDSLVELEVSQRGTDVAGALREATRILAESEFPRDQRVIYVISDMPVSHWLDATDGAAAVSAARKASGQVRPSGLVFVPVGRDGPGMPSPPPNVAVTGLREAGGNRMPTADGGGRSVRLEVDVANYSDRATGEMHLRVSTDSGAGAPGSTVVRRVNVEPPAPYGVRTVPFSVAPGEPGSVAITVAVESARKDSLESDDWRTRSIEFGRAVTVLLVEGRSGATALSGDAGYLSTALAPDVGMASAAPVRVRTVPAAGMGAEPFDSYDVIALCNVGRPEEGAWSRLSDFVRAGGGLLVFGGDAIEAAAYNSHGHAAGEGPLPARIKGVVGDLEREDDFVRIASERFTHPMLAELAGHSDSGLFLARVYRRLSVEPTSTHAGVLLRYTDGSPAMVAGRFGAGRVLFVTTSADMSWTNLPAKGDYVSLMASAVAWLAPSRSAHRTITVGGVFGERLDAAESGESVRVRNPDGSAHRGRVVPASGAFRFEHGPVDEAGVYAVTIGSRRVMYAVNVDTRESDLRSVDETQLRELLNCDFTYVDSSEVLRRSAARAATHEVGNVLLYAVALLVVAESWLAMRYGARR